MKKFKNISLIVTSLVLGFAVLAYAPLTLAATSKDAICDGANISGTGTGCSSSGADIQTTITWIINVLSVVVGIVAVIMIIVGGFKYVTSSGDSNNTASAKNTIIYAIVGIIVVALAQTIVRFVIHKSTNP